MPCATPASHTVTNPSHPLRQPQDANGRGKYLRQGVAITLLGRITDSPRDNIVFHNFYRVGPVKKEKAPKSAGLVGV